MALMNFKGIFRKRESTDASSLAEAMRAGAVNQAASSRVSVDQNTSLQCSAYLRALNVIAQHIAVLPFRYMVLKNDVYEEKDGSNMHYLLSVQMQENMSNYQWYYQLTFQTVHYGEALVWPRIIAGEVSEFVLIKQGCFSHDTTNNTYDINDVENGVFGTFAEAEVLHFVWNSKDGKKGFPLWKLCKPALDIYATGDKETQKRFESGGHVMGIISNNVQQGGAGVGQYKTSNLEDVAKQMRAQFSEGYGIAAVGGDAKFSQISSSSADMQMTEQLKRVVLEISRAAGVPSYMLFVETSGTQYNTPEVSDKALLTQTIEPMARMIESEFQRKMIPRQFCHKRIFRFDRDAIYSLDLKSKADYYMKMQQVGAWSVNDVRHKENMPKVKDGDKIYVSTNMAELGSQKLAGQTDEPDTKPTVEPGQGSTEGDEPQKKEKPRDEHGRFIKQH